MANKHVAMRLHEMQPSALHTWHLN